MLFIYIGTRNSRLQSRLVGVKMTKVVVEEAIFKYFLSAVTLAIPLFVSNIVSAECRRVTYEGGVEYGVVSYTRRGVPYRFEKAGVAAYHQAINVSRCNYTVPGKRGFWCRSLRDEYYFYHKSESGVLYTAEASPGACRQPFYKAPQSNR